MPTLRIVEQVLWDRVKARQATLDRGPAGNERTPGNLPSWRQQRPKHLLSDLLRCGVCGGGMSMISATHLGCSTARDRGDAVCANRRTAKRSDVEGEVLDAVSTRLMAPEVRAAFTHVFAADWN